MIVHKLLEYPFDGQLILRKKKAIRRELLEEGNRIEKRIAILGGSTTHDIKDIMELFLLDYGIQPIWYESAYGQFWEDAVFSNEELEALQPDVIYIHTSIRNIESFPEPSDAETAVDELLAGVYNRFVHMWESIGKKYHCPIIQNNFEYPFYRLMGNQDAADIHGRVNFVTRLNLKFYEYAQTHEDFLIHDINYLSADYGLERWADPFFWHMYKYTVCLDAIPTFAFSVSNLIKALFGKNKKAFALDLDNTLWGGIVGDDGAENLVIGKETAMGQVYTEFQQYLLEMKQRGVLLSIVSKNDYQNAIAGLTHPDNLLKPDDFVSIKANWEPKSTNLFCTAQEMSLLPESFVFVDDNPAERAIIRQQIPGVAVPDIDRAERYIQVIDHSGFFEMTGLSDDDMKRSEMYRENVARIQLKSSFLDYGEYLRSLEMEAILRPFEPLYMSRIAQLTNKSNQFNLTALRCTRAELEQFATDPSCITLYGRLMDRFGDNGIVTVVIGKESEGCLDLILWLMSCRVLKRDLEYAVMDTLVGKCQERNINTIRGYYYPTTKNGMVSDFYEKQGFIKISESVDGSTVWQLDLRDGYTRKNHVIQIYDNKEQ